MYLPAPVSQLIECMDPEAYERSMKYLSAAEYTADQEEIIR